MQPSLSRELTLTGATALVISNMIGTGIFTTSGFLARDLGRPSLVLTVWAVGAVIAMAGCLSYAELGLNIPRAGGEYAYIREAWGPTWGFLSGWISFFAGFAGPIAAGALAFTEYLAYFFPSLSMESRESLGPGFFGWLRLGNGQLVALAVIALFSFVNVFGLRLAAKLQILLTILKVGILAAFLILGLSLGQGDWSHFTETPHGASPHGLGAQFAVSLVFVMFAYSGWNAASYVAEEMKSPERTLPRALVFGTALVAFFYVALNVVFIYALPLASMQGVVRVGSAAAVALFGSKVGGLFSGVMAAAVLSCVSAMVIVGPRVYYAMAQDGSFFPGAARVHPRWKTPVQAIGYQAVASGIMVLTGTFESLLYYIGFALIFFVALAGAGLVRLRRRPGWKRLGAVSWAYPLVPVVFVGASLWILLYTLFGRPTESLLGLLTLAAGALFYRLKIRRAS